MGWHPIRRGARLVVDARDRREQAGGTVKRRARASRWGLSDFDLFAKVPRAELDSLEPAPSLVELQGRAPVVVDDDAVRVVVSGGIKLARIGAMGRKLIVALLGPGDVFGRISAGGSHRDPDDGQVLEPLEDTALLIIARPAFEQLLASQSFAYKLVQVLEERERTLLRRVEGLVFKDVRTRLIETLLELASEHGEVCAHGMAVDVRVNQQDLADLIGASRQMVNRILGELSRSLHVRRMGKVLCVLNIRRLERLVQGS